MSMNFNNSMRNISGTLCSVLSRSALNTYFSTANLY